MTSSGVRLTELASLAGCTGKAGADALQFVLGHLQALAGSEDGLAEPDDVLVGLRDPDDAAVYRLSDEQALVVTIDFFAPPVDDPYSYGAISAANAVSDVYAMGADVAFALNVSGFPIDLDREVVSEILRGGVEKMAEAGGVIVGGHTIIDAEPKYGLCVLGFVHPDRIFTKAGARPGETLYLTKPLGTGLITTAAKFEEAEAGHLEVAIESMSRLNQSASRIVRDEGVCALTDVTGFGILGHGYEMADASGVELRLDATALPLLPGAMEYAYRGVVSGGGFRNREHLDGRVRISPAISEDMQHVLYDPQTSGGLLFSLPRDRAARVEEGFARADMPLWRIGEVVAGHGVTVVP
jgi:selenide,water dikinase